MPLPDSALLNERDADPAAETCRECGHVTYPAYCAPCGVIIRTGHDEECIEDPREAHAGHRGYRVSAGRLR